MTNNKLNCMVMKEYTYCLNEFKNNDRKSIITLSFDLFEYYNDFRVLGLLAYDIVINLKERDGIDTCYYLDYSGKKVIVYRRLMQMINKYTVEIPYKARSKYFDFIEEVNNLVGASGLVMLWVNNIPYSLQSYLTIEASEHGEEVKYLIEKYELENDTSRGIEQFIEEMGHRQWDFVTVPIGKGGAESAYALYRFAEEEELIKKGYSMIHVERKKVFISYCHANRGIVLQVTEEMEKAGINLWLDKQEIDAGDSILEKVMSGIEESDLSIIFVSRNTVDAQFARHELRTIWNKIIYNQKKWFIVKLDDVDMESVYPGLSQYLYYDMQNNSDINNLIKAVKKKINKL